MRTVDNIGEQNEHNAGGEVGFFIVESDLSMWIFNRVVQPTAER